MGVPVAVDSVYPQGEHVFGVLDAPPGAGSLEALLGVVAMGAFDLAGADGQSVGQGLAIVQRVGAGAAIAMAVSHGRAFVVGLGRLAMSGERPQDGVETPPLSASFCVSIQASRATGSGAIAAEAAIRT